MRIARKNVSIVEKNLLSNVGEFHIVRSNALFSVRWVRTGFAAAAWKNVLRENI